MSTQPISILLRGGTLLLHDDTDHVVPTHADLLIEGQTIAKIEKNIPPPPGAKVIDCTSKLVSPGFVSTHAHLWQTQLKGLHPNHTLVEYMPLGCYTVGFYTASDLFWGELSGALEALDGGTTTVVDHSHCNLGPDYPRAAVQALATSGLRTVYCYTPQRRATSFNPLKLEEANPTTDPRVLEDFGELAAHTYGGKVSGGLEREEEKGEGRVSIGFSMDNFFLPTAALQSLYAKLREPPARARLITSHAVGGPAFGGRPYGVGILDRAGLLGPDVLFSHAPGLADEDVAALRRAGAFVSSTPNTEMQMGMEPVSMWPSVREGRVGSLGVDCHTWGTSYMPTQMNLILQQHRLSRALEVGREGKWVRHVEGSAGDVFNLATVAGARAVGMEGQVGRLRIGYKADVVVFDGTSPSMLAAAMQDPVAAVVLHSSIRDVDTVIVDGIVRKEHGKLCHVQVEEAPVGLTQKIVGIGRTISWEEVAEETLKSREAIKGKIGEIDFGPAEEAVIDNWHMNRAAMVEK